MPSLFAGHQRHQDVRKLLDGDEHLSASIVSAAHVQETERWPHGV
jgi:hypothetical protein